MLVSEYQHACRNYNRCKYILSQMLLVNILTKYVAFNSQSTFTNLSLKFGFSITCRVITTATFIPITTVTVCVVLVTDAVHYYIPLEEWKIHR